MVEGWRDFLSAWDEPRVEVDEYRELDDERVLVLVRFVTYFDRGRALADLGLASEAGSGGS